MSNQKIKTFTGLVSKEYTGGIFDDVKQWLEKSDVKAISISQCVVDVAYNIIILYEDKV